MRKFNIVIEETPNGIVINGTTEKHEPVTPTEQLLHQLVAPRLSALFKELQMLTALIPGLKAAYTQGKLVAEYPTCIVLESEKGPAICCKKCGLTSHLAEDVKNLFCGKCEYFHTK